MSGGIETLRTRRQGKAERELLQHWGLGAQLVCGARLKGPSGELTEGGEKAEDSIVQGLEERLLNGDRWGLMV